MKTDRPPDTVRAYLDALRSALKGSSPGLIDNALASMQIAVRDRTEVGKQARTTASESYLYQS